MTQTMLILVLIMDLDQLEIEVSVIYKGEKINVDISDEALESIQEDIELTYNEEHKESEEEWVK